MGLFQSLSKSVNDNTHTCVPKKNTEIGILLSKLDANPSKDDREFKIIKRLEVDTRKLQMSLATMMDNETFKQFDTYQMISEKMPAFVLEKQPRGVLMTTYAWDYPRYYDIYGSTDTNDDIKQILITYISTDTADIVLQYCGDTFLFSVKTRQHWGMVITMYTLVVGDALTIHSGYSEQSGRSNRVRINKDYDKKLLMYLAYIIHEISEVGHVSYNRYQRRIFDNIEFHFPAFMAFEILEKPRPPPREHMEV